MIKLTRPCILLLLSAILLLGSCGILKKNSCGCPEIPTSGKMRH